MQLNDLVTLERGRLSWFRYSTHNIGTYLGRGVKGNIMCNHVVLMSLTDSNSIFDADVDLGESVGVEFDVIV